MEESLTLLIVDDDELDRQAARRALARSDLATTVIEASDGAAALQELRRGAFDCILLDYRLPGSTGLELLRQMRGLGVTTPVIMLTGQGDEQIAVELIKAGAADYIAKGRLSPERLSNSIRQTLRVYRAEQQAARAETQRRQAELRLRQHERLLATTLKSIGDAVIATDEQGRVTFINAAAEALTGWSARDAQGQPLAAVLPLAEAAAGVTLAQPASVMDEHVVRDAWLHTRDGRSVPIASHSAPIRNDDGAPVGAVVVLRDMSARVRSEERLRLLADLSRLLIDSFDYRQHLQQVVNLIVPRYADWCAIDVLLADGRLHRLAGAPALETPAAADTSPVPASLGPARVISSGQSEHIAQLSDAQIVALAQAEPAVPPELKLRSWICVPLIVRDQVRGAISFARARHAPAYDADDVAFAEEIARRTAHAVDNALLYQQAQEAVQARDAFLSIAAHELKTPLTSLLGYAELLQRRLARNPVAEERELRLLNVIVDQTRRLNRLIGVLFDLSRLQIGQFTIVRQPLDFVALTARIIGEVQPTLERHQLHFELPATPIRIIGDDLRLEQVLQNLLQNAVKYSPNGGTIDVRLTQHHNWARLVVHDQGMGIPAEALPNIFQRFYRAANAERRNDGGIGVGLYVAQQIVELHGGHIDVESIEGRGSTFTVWLPLAPAEAHAER
ncbi:ATP-binding protein [Kallotenue papyrolyticum]|uniref:ATP-binding protein n=1 Tax=Kallotenue papyrolyticum TaxID=1325125 RepID=UPI000478598D|nr:ATP-binding protein [Kallotenue papyrolyticum]